MATLLGNGDGTFQPLIDTPVNGIGVPNVQPLVVGDFNRDGKLDVTLLYAAYGTGATLLGNGDGTFRSISSGAGGVIVAAGDLNGDGILDLATSDYGLSVTTYKGNGDGTFRGLSTYTTCAGSQNFAFNAGLNIVDVNHDGKLDVVSAYDEYFSTGYMGCASVYIGNGDGTLSAGVSYQAGQQAQYATVADYDGDGNPDIAFSLEFGVGLLLGNPDGTFQNVVDYLAPQSDYITVADVNGDGLNDVVITSAEGFTHVLLSLGESSAATLSQSRLTFGDQIVGTSSVPKSVTLTSTGKGPLKITSIVASASYAQTNNCGSVVEPGASCQISIRFLPRSRGPEAGSVTISDNAANSPQVIQLKGTGTVVQCTPVSVDFGSERVGHTSPPATVTLTNLGKSSLSISGVSIEGPDAGDFAQTNTCGSSVLPGADCFITVTFTPSARGKRKAEVSVGDNGGGSPQQVALTGTGT